MQELTTFEPAQVYERPFDVLKDMTLSRPEQIEILHQWLADAVRAAGGGSAREAQRDGVCAVTKALQFLGAPIEVF